MNRPKSIDLIEKQLKLVNLPWEATGNVPFYIDLKKPRPSLSKHDLERPSYWHFEDGAYVLACVNSMPELLQYIKELEKQLDNSEIES